METEIDRRTYDVLRLVEQHGPIGSIRLVDLMTQHGYDLKDRTVRLILSDLDDRGLTTKVPGKGRTLTDRGERELRRGDVAGRLERVRRRIATMTSQVSYDPVDETGALVACSAIIEEENLRAAFACLERLADTPIGPVPVALDDTTGSETDRYQLLIPSSITLDGVFLTHGINTELRTAGIIEYDPTETGTDSAYGDTGGSIRRYVDVISGEGSSIDVVSLLIEAGRTAIRPIHAEESAFLVADDRTVPIGRLVEARDLSVATRTALGGAIRIERSREDGRTTGRDVPWGFGSVTYAGTGEVALAALHEADLLADWNTLYGVEDATVFEPVRVVSADALSEW
mgnify:CR=1 FL=1